MIEFIKGSFYGLFSDFDRHENLVCLDCSSSSRVSLMKLHLIIAYFFLRIFTFKRILTFLIFTIFFIFLKDLFFRRLRLHLSSNIFFLKIQIRNLSHLIKTELRIRVLLKNVRKLLRDSFHGFYLDFIRLLFYGISDCLLLLNYLQILSESLPFLQ